MDKYSVKLVRSILENYSLLEQGQYPSEMSGGDEMLIDRKGKKRAPFEMAVIMKADVDRAMRKLPPILGWVVTWVDILGLSENDFAYIRNKTPTEVIRMEEEAVERISRTLSRR